MTDTYRSVLMMSAGRTTLLSALVLMATLDLALSVYGAGSDPVNNIAYHLRRVMADARAV